MHTVSGRLVLLLLSCFLVCKGDFWLKPPGMLKILGEPLYAFKIQHQLHSHFKLKKLHLYSFLGLWWDAAHAFALKG